MRKTYKERYGHERTRKASGSRERDRRRMEAIERAQERAIRNVAEQLERLADRPGESWREADRLRRMA